jgi:putative FmdB family regulatory protein
MSRTAQATLMPIVRTYQCEDCNHRLEVTLAGGDWDAPPPPCPECAARSMSQQFRPVAITGSPSARAHAIAEDIAANDYHVADMTEARKEGDVPKVRYKDQATAAPSTWVGPNAQMMSQAIAIGRETRLNFGDGLDVLHANLKNGTQPDLIEMSKRRSIKIW